MLDQCVGPKHAFILIFSTVLLLDFIVVFLISLFLVSEYYIKILLSESFVIFTAIPIYSLKISVSQKIVQTCH